MNDDDERIDPPSEDEPDLPDPEFETVRNFSALPEWIKRVFYEGLFVALGGPEENAIRVGSLWGLLKHLDKLYLAVQANQSGREVNRFGSLAAVPGGRALEAWPAFNGSYALPIRLTPPDGQLVGQEYRELEVLMELLAPSTDLGERLPELPERIGDELRSLLKVIARDGTNVRVEMIRDGAMVSQVEVGADHAQLTVDWLEEKSPHELGTETLRGKLFRIDVKRMEIAIDVLDDEDGDANVEKATFQDDQLEELRAALNHPVEIEVGVSEDRRPYERSVTSPKLSVNWVRRIEVDS